MMKILLRLVRLKWRYSLFKLYSTVHPRQCWLSKKTCWQFFYITGCNPEDPPNDGDTTIECLTEDCLGLILDMVSTTVNPI